MSDFAVMIEGTNKAWEVADGKLKGLTAEVMADPAKFSKALLEAQMQISIASSVEQKASSAIDKAYQAHGQVASK
jgi:hypothetical protein